MPKACMIQTKSERWKRPLSLVHLRVEVLPRTPHLLQQGPARPCHSAHVPLCPTLLGHTLVVEQEEEGSIPRSQEVADICRYFGPLWPTPSSAACLWCAFMWNWGSAVALDAGWIRTPNCFCVTLPDWGRAQVLPDRERSICLCVRGNKVPQLPVCQVFHTSDKPQALVIVFQWAQGSTFPSFRQDPKEGFEFGYVWICHFLQAHS